MAYFLLFVLHGSWKVCMFVVALFVRNKCHSCNFFVRSFVRQLKDILQWEMVLLS